MSDAVVTPVHVSFLMKHPTGGEVSRPNRCKCGRDFTQNRVNPDWLNSPAWKNDRERFGEIFEITDTREVWIPRACPWCERVALDFQAQLKAVR